MPQDRSGTTARLLELCVGYFAAYTLTGVLVKWLPSSGIPKLPEMTYLFNNTIGGSVLALGLVIVLGWFKLRSNRLVKVGPFQVPSEVGYIIPSGVCTAIVIPTTTLMYSLPISVLVAMVIMRGSIIVISRLVDELQLRQGNPEEARLRRGELGGVVRADGGRDQRAADSAGGRARSARGRGRGPAGLKAGAGKGELRVPPLDAAMTILGSYIVAYAFRLYIMNYFKNTRAAGVPRTTRATSRSSRSRRA
jgi:hypothetical protein